MIRLMFILKTTFILSSNKYFMTVFELSLLMVFIISENVSVTKTNIYIRLYFWTPVIHLPSETPSLDHQME